MTEHEERSKRMRDIEDKAEKSSQYWISDKWSAFEIEVWKNGFSIGYQNALNAIEDQKAENKD